MKYFLMNLMLVIPLLDYGQNPFLIPDTLSGSTIDLNLQNGQVDDEQFNLSDYTAGGYYFNVTTTEQSQTYKIVKK